jgi:hypothetical protein
MNAYDIPGRCGLWVLIEEWQKWIHNLEKLIMRRLNKIKRKKKIMNYFE